MTAKVTCEYCDFYDYPNRVDLHVEKTHTVAVLFHAFRSADESNVIKLQIEADSFGHSIQADWLQGTILLKTNKKANVVTINVLSHTPVLEGAKA